MTKLYRFELECYESHFWISSATEEETLGYDSCPICGGKLRGFERYTLTEALSFVLEPAEKLNFKNKLVDDKRFYIAIQDHRGNLLARNPRSYTWEDAISLATKLKSITPRILLKSLKNKNWSFYSDE